MKKTSHVQDTHVSGSSFPYTTILATILVVILAFLASEYFFQIPSRFFTQEEQEKIDISRPESSGSESTERPSICTMEYAPVCGMDNQTYGNACMARGAGIVIEKDGECDAGDVSPISTPTAPSQMSSPEASESDMAPGNEAPVISTEVENPVGIITTEVFDTGSYQIYTNTSFGYSLALPKYVYYQGYGARDGAVHALAVSLTGTGVDDFATADVRVYYYKTEPSDVVAGATRVMLTGGSTLIIDSGNSTNPKIQKIVDTIRMSAK